MTERRISLMIGGEKNIIGLSGRGASVFDIRSARFRVRNGYCLQGQIALRNVKRRH